MKRAGFFLAMLAMMAMPGQGGAQEESGAGAVPAAAVPPAASSPTASSPAVSPPPAGSAAVPQQDAPVAPPQQPKPATVQVTIQTAEGPIVLELEKERAPVTTANFLRYVDAKLYDGATFYRAINMAEDFGLVQGGITILKPGQKLFAPIAHEPTSKTGLSHQTGTVSMARAEQGTARMDFFITVGDMSSLDAHPENPGDNAGFAAFGHVVQGMDVVMKIMRSPISPTAGEDNGMKGQMLAAPVGIVTARRTPPADKAVP
ncbi:MAG: peptidylprolyl isomerase [Sphingobium sp.]